MTNAKKLACLLGLMALPLSLGCASAYHDYCECNVDCHYCIHPPLPYVHYEGCVCHSCAASNVLALPSRELK